MVKSKEELIKKLDDFILETYLKRGIEQRIGVRKTDVIDKEENYKLCAFCLGLSIEYRLGKYRFCEKDWKLLELFSQLQNI